ncbi:MAG: ABC transporter ATP-binding protein, partial [Rhodanobacteraceae bacterium]
EEAEQLCRNIAIIDHGEIIENNSMRRLLATLDVQSFVLDVCGLGSTPPVIEGVQVTRRDAQTLEVEMPSTHDLNALFAALTAAGIKVTSMRTRTNRLEALFLRLVEHERGVSP